MSLLFAHVTHVEAPGFLIVFAAGIAVGFGLAMISRWRGEQ